MTWIDHMLLWLSAKESGSWSQFRTAVEELREDDNPAGELGDEDNPFKNADNDLPIYQEIRLGLQRLGHVEFYTDNDNNRWRVVPPTVAFFPDSNTNAVLCGARCSSLLNALVQNPDVKVFPTDIAGMPQRMVLQGNSGEAIANHARVLGLCIQRSAPIAILSVLPSVRDPRVWQLSEIPVTPGWFVQRFSSSLLQWTEVLQPQAVNADKGLFRFVQKHQRFYYLRWNGRSYRIPVQVGKYAVVRNRRGNIKYDAARRIISFPAILRPPLLMERALVLCSGRLPDFNPASNSIEYGDVPRHVAELVGQLLCQGVR